MNKENIIDLKPIILNFAGADNMHILYNNMDIIRLFRSISCYEECCLHLVRDIYDPFGNRSYNGLLMSIVCRGDDPQFYDYDYAAMREYFSITWNLYISYKCDLSIYVISKNQDGSEGIKLVPLNDSIDSVDDMFDHISMIGTRDCIRLIIIDKQFYSSCPNCNDPIAFSKDEFNICAEDTNQDVEAESENSLELDWIPDPIDNDDKDEDSDEDYNTGFFDYYYEDDL